jgi:hypothetical protein
MQWMLPFIEDVAPQVRERVGRDPEALIYCS